MLKCVLGIVLFGVAFFAQVPYKIIKEKESKRGGLSGGSVTHLTIKVELENRASKQDLKKLANKLAGHRRSQYFRIWMFYYLKDQPKNVWATTHFEPDLKVNILGTSDDQEKKLSRAADGLTDVVGRWRDAELNGVVVIYKKDKRLFMKLKFSDGSEMDKPLQKDGDKYWYKNDHNESYRMEGKNLRLYVNDKKTEVVHVRID